MSTSTLLLLAGGALAAMLALTTASGSAAPSSPPSSAPNVLGLPPIEPIPDVCGRHQIFKDLTIKVQGGVKGGVKQPDGAVIVGENTWEGTWDGIFYQMPAGVTPRQVITAAYGPAAAAPDSPVLKAIREHGFNRVRSDAWLAALDTLPPTDWGETLAQFFGFTAYEPGGKRRPIVFLPYLPGTCETPMPEVLQLNDRGTAHFGEYSVHHLSVGEGGPLVWLLHGLAGEVDQLLPYIPTQHPGEYYLVSHGSSWIADPKGAPEKVALQLAARGADLQTLQAVLRDGRTVPWVVLGYSQGGAVAYQLATATGADLDDTRAPDVAIAVAARLPSVAGAPVFPPKVHTRIRAIAGGADTTVPPAEAFAAVKRFADAGYQTTWQQLPGVSHSLTTLGTHIRRLLDEETQKAALA